jgi:hypothetical protein
MKVLSACIVIGVTIIGCGSSSGGGGGSNAAASCGMVAACGGDVVGAWTIQAGCASIMNAPSIPNCPNAKAQDATVTASGTTTFNSDMTYTSDTTESASETVVIPTSCLSSGGMTVSCQTLGQILGGALMSDAGTTTASCTMSGSNCNCMIGGSTSSHTTGKYSLSGNMITTTPQGGMPSTADYCVAPDGALHVIASTMGVSQDVVATK